MTVAASDIIGLGSTPTNPDQLWALGYLFACDWGANVKLHQSFITDVTRSQSDVEQRRGLVLSPARLMEVNLLIRKPEIISNFRLFMLRASNARFLMPLYMDQLIVNSVTGTNQLNFASPQTTVDHRYFVGAWVAVINFYTRAVSIAIITGVNANYITISGAAYSAANVGNSVFPLFEAEVILEQSSAMITDGIIDATLSVAESRGAYSLDAMQAIGSNPGGVSYNGYPVLTLDPDYESANILAKRSGERVQSSRGSFLQLYGPRARWSYELNYKQFNRTKAMNLIRFFEAMGGRLKPFYLLSPLTDFKAVSFTGTSVTVQADMLTVDWDFYGQIGVRMKDGSVQIRVITGVTTPSAGLWTLTVAAWDVPPSLASIVRLSLAHLVRFDTDEMAEEWVTNSVMVTSLKFIEVINEKDISIVGIKDFTLGYS